MNESGFSNPGSEEIRQILASVKNIAVVGLSPKPARPSFQVAKALQDYGFKIIPVRPAVDSVLGEQAYANLQAVPDKIDMVDVFLSADKIAPVVDTCIELAIPVLWLQDGVVNLEEAMRARRAGVTVIMDRCTWRDYHRLFGK